MADQQEQLRITNLFSSESMGETRTVDVAERGGIVQVWEETYGPVTESLFGNLDHTRRIELNRDGVRKMAGYVGKKDEPAPSVLGSFFSSGEASLLDFQDWLGERQIDFKVCPDGAPQI